MKAILFALICSITIAWGQILWKMGLNTLEIENFFTFSTFKKLLTSPYILIGFTVYIFATIFWMYTLNMFKLSYIYPLLSITYIISLILSFTVLKEPVPTVRWIGVIILIIGIYFITKN